MGKQGIPEALVRAVMSLYKGAKTKVGTCLSEEFEANIGVHQGSVLSPLLFAIADDVATNEIKEGTLEEIWPKLRECKIYLAEKNSLENQRKCKQKLCEISNTLWTRDMVPGPE